MLQDAGIEPPINALCLGCGYSLRTLGSGRCPECGRMFDPSDPRTMDMGVWNSRLLRALVGPLQGWIRRAVVLSSIAILWGSAWLPGADWVRDGGWLLLLACVVYSLLRRCARLMLRWYFKLGRLPRQPSEKFSRRQLLVLALAMSAPIGWWPLRLHMWIERPLLDRFGWHMYAEVPMLNQPPPPRMIGLFIARDAGAGYDGTSIGVLGGGSLHYRPDGRKGPEWWESDAPWYFGWLQPPRAGPWSANPHTPSPWIRFLRDAF